MTSSLLFALVALLAAALADGSMCGQNSVVHSLTGRNIASSFSSMNGLTTMALGSEATLDRVYCDDAFCHNTTVTSGWNTSPHPMLWGLGGRSLWTLTDSHDIFGNSALVFQVEGNGGQEAFRAQPNTQLTPLVIKAQEGLGVLAMYGQSYKAQLLQLFMWPVIGLPSQAQSFVFNAPSSQNISVVSATDMNGIVAFAVVYGNDIQFIDCVDKGCRNPRNFSAGEINLPTGIWLNQDFLSLTFVDKLPVIGISVKYQGMIIIRCHDRNCTETERSRVGKFGTLGKVATDVNGFMAYAIYNAPSVRLTRCQDKHCENYIHVDLKYPKADKIQMELLKSQSTLQLAIVAQTNTKPVDGPMETEANVWMYRACL